MIRPNPSSAGFTLIELLIVISIIALLIGVLLPVLSNSREVGRMVRCLSNMRMMGLAAVNYAYESDGVLPTVGLAESGGSLDENGSWLVQLQEFVDTPDGLDREPLLYRCPSDESPFFDSPSPTNGRFRRTSYALPLTLGMAPGFERFDNLDNIPSPSSTIFAVELVEGGPGDDRNGFVSADHVHAESWLDARAGRAGDERVGREVQIDQHLGRANYVFLDGHGETLRRDETILSSGPIRFLQWEANLYWPQIAR
ncbi:MAG: DUF1559 domain-containing protein [Planctomycetota bacterium]